jgi:hypothetical protein
MRRAGARCSCSTQLRNHGGAQRPRKVPHLSTRARHPRRARAYLVTDNDVTDTVARYAATRPQLDSISRLALAAGSQPPAWQPSDEPIPGHSAARPDNADTGEPLTVDEQQNPDAVLRRALSAAPAEGVPVSDLITMTSMSRRWVFYRLRQLAADGYDVQTVRGYWRTAR